MASSYSLCTEKRAFYSSPWREATSLQSRDRSNEQRRYRPFRERVECYDRLAIQKDRGAPTRQTSQSIEEYVRTTRKFRSVVSPSPDRRGVNEAGCRMLCYRDGFLSRQGQCVPRKSRGGCNRNDAIERSCLNERCVELLVMNTEGWMQPASSVFEYFQSVIVELCAAFIEVNIQIRQEAQIGEDHESALTNRNAASSLEPIYSRILDDMKVPYGIRRLLLASPHDDSAMTDGLIPLLCAERLHQERCLAGLRTLFRNLPQTQQIPPIAISEFLPRNSFLHAFPCAKHDLPALLRDFAIGIKGGTVYCGISTNNRDVHSLGLRRDVKKFSWFVSDLPNTMHHYDWEWHDQQGMVRIFETTSDLDDEEVVVTCFDVLSKDTSCSNHSSSLSTRLQHRWCSLHPVFKHQTDYTRSNAIDSFGC